MIYLPLPPLSPQSHQPLLPPPSQTKNSKQLSEAKLTGWATSDEPLYLLITPAMTKRAFIVIVWDISESTANFIPALLVFVMLQTTSRIVAHFIVVSIPLTPYLLHPLHLTTLVPLLDRFVQYHLLWQTDSLPLLLDTLSEGLVVLVLLLCTSIPLPFNSLDLPPRVLTTTMSMTLTLGETSMAIKVFQRCFNANMGIML